MTREKGETSLDDIDAIQAEHYSCVSQDVPSLQIYNKRKVDKYLLFWSVQ